MADNVTLPGTGASVATDDVGGVQFQKMKINLGATGVDGGEVTADNPFPTAVYGELVEAIEALRMTMGSLSRTIGLSIPDLLGRQRVVVDAITGALTLATVATVGTVTNQTQIGALNATDQIPALMHMSADSLRRNITVT